MPTYEYFCKKCEVVTEVVHSIKEDPVLSCEDCGDTLERQISLNGNFILKGWDGWGSKVVREKGFREKKNRDFDSRKSERLERYKPPVMIPNVDGQQVDSWSEARRLAISKNYDASTYDSVIEKEKLV